MGTKFVILVEKCSEEINLERDFKTNRKLWYLVQYWYFSIYISDEVPAD